MRDGCSSRGLGKGNARARGAQLVTSKSKTEQKKREADGMTPREDPALPRFRDGDLSLRTMLLIGAPSAPMAGLDARFFTVIDVHHGRSRPDREQRCAFRYPQRADRRVITTYVLLETSADSRDTRERGVPSSNCICHLIPACGDSMPRTPTQMVPLTLLKAVARSREATTDLHLQSRARAR